MNSARLCTMSEQTGDAALAVTGHLALRALMMGLTFLGVVSSAVAGGDGAPASGRIESMYSNLAPNKCKSMRSAKGGAAYGCAGIAGYSLIIEDDDARMSVTVVTPRGATYPLNYWHVITRHFSTLGHKAEWRVVRRNGKTEPVALIIRVRAQESDSKTTLYLAVAKITPDASCVTDRIVSGPSSNVEARQAADSAATKSCLEELK